MRAVLLGVSTILMIGSMAGCSDHASPTPPETSSSDAPFAPSMTNPTMTTISADPKAAETLSKGGSKAQDAWYIGTMHAAGVTIPDSGLFQIRDLTCGLLRDGSTLDNLTDAFTSWPLDATQQGVAISSSMISRCPDTRIIMDAAQVPSMPPPETTPPPSPGAPSPFATPVTTTS